MNHEIPEMGDAWSLVFLSNRSRPLFLFTDYNRVYAHLNGRRESCLHQSTVDTTIDKAREKEYGAEERKDERVRETFRSYGGSKDAWLLDAVLMILSEEHRSGVKSRIRSNWP
ncbi:hypothetical protein BT93_A1260 [Corymbia citriodora subsp. variegata]|nr:hypothetical protein BT93_A1260 [Corymbia citriodora subsp. variegata]